MGVQQRLDFHQYLGALLPGDEAQPLSDIAALHLIPILEKNGPYDLRTYIVAGTRDRYCYGVAQQLAKMLPNYGIECKLEVYPDLEHQFPQDFESRLPEALDFVMQR
jgi:predicted esterase